MKGHKSLGSSSHSLSNCSANYGRSFQEPLLCVNPVDIFALLRILMENILSLLSSFWLFLFSFCSSVFPSFFLFPPPCSGSNSRCFSSVVETVSAGLHFSCNSLVRKLFNLGFNSLGQNRAVCNPCVLITVS